MANDASGAGADASAGVGADAATEAGAEPEPEPEPVLKPEPVPEPVLVLLALVLGFGLPRSPTYLAADLGNTSYTYDYYSTMLNKYREYSYNTIQVSGIIALHLC